MAADQAVDLGPEGKERHQIDQAQQSEENLAGEEVAGLLFAGSDQEHIDAVGGFAVRGDEAVGGFGDCGESRDKFIEPQEPRIAMSEFQGAEDGLGAAGNAAVWFDQMYGAAEGGGVDLWKAGRGLLEGFVIHELPGD